MLCMYKKVLSLMPGPQVVAPCLGGMMMEKEEMPAAAGEDAQQSPAHTLPSSGPAAAVPWSPPTTAALTHPKTAGGSSKGPLQVTCSSPLFSLQLHLKNAADVSVLSQSAISPSTSGEQITPVTRLASLFPCFRRHGLK